MSNIFPIDFEEKLTMAQNDYILFSDSEDGNKIKKAQYKNLKGEKGNPGTAATISVGTVSTGAAGSSATVVNSGTSSAAILDFTIPQGAKGEPGEDGQDGQDGNAATITVGTTTTLPAGSSATVENVGTSSAAIFNFGIPQGTPGTGTGDVSGPNTSVDGDIALFDGVTGKLIKDGSKSLSDLQDTLVSGTNIKTINNTSILGSGDLTVGGDVGISTDTGNLLTAGDKLWFGSESDFSGISTPDSSTLYIQYKSDSPTPPSPRTPGANTVLYMPFDTDLLDHGPNNISFTTYGTAPTISGGVSVWDGQGYLYTSPITSQYMSNHIFTVSSWVNLSTTPTGDMGWVTDCSYPSYAGWDSIAHPNGWRLENATASSQVWYNPISQFVNAWNLVTIVWNGSSADLYVNGNNEQTLSNGTFTDGTFAFCVGKIAFWNQDMGVPSGVFQGNMSQLIIEDKARTATEISDYFNATKGNYGIS